MNETVNDPTHDFTSHHPLLDVERLGGGMANERPGDVGDARGGGRKQAAPAARRGPQQRLSASYAEMRASLARGRLLR